MRRRDFIELSAAASASILLGGLAGFQNPHFIGNEDIPLNRYPNPRMHGGCRDFRIMNASIPGFFEREIIDSWV